MNSGISRPIELLGLLDLAGDRVSLRIEIIGSNRMRLVAIANDWRNLNSVLVKVLARDELVELIDKLKEAANRMEAMEVTDATHTKG